MSPKSPIPGGWPSSSQLTVNTSNASFPLDPQNGDIAPAEATVGHFDCPPSPLSMHTTTSTLKDASPNMMPVNHSCSPSDASSSSHVRRAVSFADSIDTAQGHSPPTASPQSNGERHDTPTELPALPSRKPRVTDALPTPPPSAMSFSSMAAVSPFIVCTSPRPIPELPSLTQSLSTAASSTAVSFPSVSFAPLSSSPSHSLQIDTDESQAALLSTDTALSSPITLNLTEPRSPDSAHFSPAHDIIAFASPASSQFELCDPAVQYEARHPVTLDSNGSPGSISTRASPSREHGPPSPRSPPGRLGMDGHDSHDFDPTSLYQLPEQSPLLPDADMHPPKRSFLYKVRKLGGRIKHLFKGSTHRERQPTPPHALATRRNSAASSLLSRRRSPRSFSITLPTPEPASPTSSRADHDEQTPQTDSDLPPSSPSPALEPPALVRTDSMRRPRSRVKLRESRRFSLPSLFLARQSPSGSAVGTRGSSRADTPSERASPAAAEPAPQIPETVLAAALPIPGDHASVRTESQRAVDRMMKDWAGSGELGMQTDAEEVGRGLGIDLARRSQGMERGRSASGPAMRV